MTVRTGFEAREPANNFEVGAGIALRIFDLSEQHDVSVNTCPTKLESQRSAIAPVVPLSAEYLSFPPRETVREMIVDCVEASLGGGLHQEKGRCLINFAREAVNLPHLLG